MYNKEFNYKVTNGKKSRTLKKVLAAVTITLLAIMSKSAAIQSHASSVNQNNSFKSITPTPINESKINNVAHQNSGPHNKIVNYNNKLYYYDQNGKLSKNYMLHGNGNVYYYFNDNGEGKLFKYNKINENDAKINSFQPAYNHINSLLMVINNKIKTNPETKQAFIDLLGVINTRNLPNLNKGSYLDDPITQLVLNKLVKDFRILGNNLNMPKLTKVSNLLDKPLQHSLIADILIGFSPIDFDQIINYMSPGEILSSKSAYIPYVKDAKLIYNTPVAVNSYDDILSRMGDLLTDNPSDQINTVKNIYHDIDIICSTPGLSNSTYYKNLLNIEAISNNIDINDAEVNYYLNTDVNIYHYPELSNVIRQDKTFISQKQRVVNDKLQDYVNNNLQAINDINTDNNKISYAASNAQSYTLRADQLDSNYASSVDASYASSVDASYASSVDASYASSVDASYASSVDASYASSVDASYASSVDASYASSVNASFRHED